MYLEEGEEEVYLETGMEERQEVDEDVTAREVAGGQYLGQGHPSQERGHPRVCVQAA